MAAATTSPIDGSRLEPTTTGDVSRPTSALIRSIGRGAGCRPLREADDITALGAGGVDRADRQLQDALGAAERAARCRSTAEARDARR